MFDGRTKNIAIFLIVLLFAVFSLVLLKQGRKIYMEINELETEKHEMENALKYLNETLRQNDKSKTISIKIDKSLSQKAIVFSGLDEDKWLFFNQGNLLELDTKKDEKISSEDLLNAKKIAKIKAFRPDYEYKNNILSYEIVYEYAGQERKIIENFFIRTE